MAIAVPWESLFGGMLLGLSATILMLFSGKIAGISGVIAGLLNPLRHESSWRAAFVTGMILSVVIVAPFNFALPELGDTNLLVIALAGMLVGFGTRLANGCTSGHGIIGMGRFSKRSIAATCTFMVTAIFVVFVKRQMGWM
ncbi:YeeE/YedE family protein [Vibrio sp. ZSDE26]|uniref:YeeE/YedE family protein n=1 Tax=Vibrio amylolyticus TaxID=2847292 RepID=A0A9X1XJL9_9VIBR|nr:YeeE/YedE thiosulfate transporter family protein [Vibrio amylolyticus]MCK6263636.1 YeeE/YedE family protein [Vibrio amylolyticus]